MSQRGDSGYEVQGYGQVSSLLEENWNQITDKLKGCSDETEGKETLTGIQNRGSASTPLENPQKKNERTKR